MLFRSSTIRNLQDAATNNEDLIKLYRAIRRVIHDDHLNGLINKMNEKVEMFERLREAMRIAMPGEKQGLKDLGTDIELNTIKHRVSTFRQSNELQQAASKDMLFRGMVEQIDKYWEKLFADPILVTTSAGRGTIQPQRTNNILEQFFRTLKADGRKKSGTNSLTRTLQTMIADTPLIKNLRNPDYTRIILNGNRDLAERFAEVDIELVRRELKENQTQPEKIPLHLRKMLRAPEFISHLVTLSVS